MQEDGHIADRGHDNRNCTMAQKDERIWNDVFVGDGKR